jgi:hypothetical protein
MAKQSTEQQGVGRHSIAASPEDLAAAWARMNGKQNNTRPSSSGAGRKLTDAQKERLGLEKQAGLPPEVWRYIIPALLGLVGGGAFGGARGGILGALLGLAGGHFLMTPERQQALEGFLGLGGDGSGSSAAATSPSPSTTQPGQQPLPENIKLTGDPKRDAAMKQLADRNQNALIDRAVEQYPELQTNSSALVPSADNLFNPVTLARQGGNMVYGGGKQMLTADNMTDRVGGALEAGVGGLIGKTVAVDPLVAGLRAAHGGTTAGLLRGGYAGAQNLLGGAKNLGLLAANAESAKGLSGLLYDQSQHGLVGGADRYGQASFNRYFGDLDPTIEPQQAGFGDYLNVPQMLMAGRHLSASTGAQQTQAAGNAQRAAAASRAAGMSPAAQQQATRLATRAQAAVPVKEVRRQVGEATSGLGARAARSGMTGPALEQAKRFELKAAPSQSTWGNFWSSL